MGQSKFIIKEVRAGAPLPFSLSSFRIVEPLLFYKEYLGQSSMHSQSKKRNLLEGSQEEIIGGLESQVLKPKCQPWSLSRRCSL